MKLTFTNKKEHKYCIFFIKALHQLASFVKQPQKPLYFAISKQQIKIASFLTDIHQGRVQNNCIIIIKQDIYTLTGQVNQRQDDCKIYLINVFKILKSFVASENKVNYIQMIIEEDNFVMSYTTEGDAIECSLELKIEAIENSPWPQHVESTREIFYQVIDIVHLKDKNLQNFKNQEEIELWLQFLPRSISIKSFIQGKVRKEDKLDFKEQTQNKYDFLTIKNKLKNKVNINLKGLILFDHLSFCYKKKKIAQLKVINIYDRLYENQLKMSYLMIKTNLQYGQIFKVIGCYICENMNEINHEQITRQIQKDRQVNKKTYLLKTQENPQQCKKIIMNRFNEVDGQANLAEQRYYQKNPNNKIQDEDATFTRKYRHKE